MECTYQGRHRASNSQCPRATFQAKLAAFRVALQHPAFSHVAFRRLCGVLIYWVYNVDTASPSGVRFAGVAVDVCTESDNIIRELGKAVQRGGLSGNASLLGYLLDE